MCIRDRASLAPGGERYEVDVQMGCGLVHVEVGGEQDVYKRQALHYAKYLSANYDVIAIAVSGLSLIQIYNVSALEFR